MRPCVRHSYGDYDHHPEPTEVGQIVDYTREGAKPGIAREHFRTDYAPRPQEPAADDVVDYTQGGSPRPSMYERKPAERSNIPGWMRHDHTRYVRDQALAESQDEYPSAWADLQAVQAAYANSGGSRLVDFSRRASDIAGPRYDLSLVFSLVP
jgi:hypothetical protein